MPLSPDRKKKMALANSKPRTICAAHPTPTTGVPKTNAIPTGWSREQISRLAEKFAKAVGFKPGEEVSPIVENQLHGRIEYLDWPDWKAKGADTIVVRGPEDFTIYLSKIGGMFDNRFSIAHEVGHYVLHSQFGEVPLVAQNSGVNERAEWEADWFAASLLMPPAQFRKQREKNPDPYFLASRFLVSPSVAEIWSKTLKLE
jgi:IrrE N-terminal-like domain